MHFHFCHEEWLAILNAFPFLPYYVARLRAFFHRRKPCTHDEV